MTSMKVKAELCHRAIINYRSGKISQISKINPSLDEICGLLEVIEMEWFNDTYTYIFLDVKSRALQQSPQQLVGVPGDRISSEYIIQSVPTRLPGCRKAKLNKLKMQVWVDYYYWSWAEKRIGREADPNKLQNQ